MRFFQGMRAELLGKAAAARTHFTACVELGGPQSRVHRWASVRLKQLDATAQASACTACGATPGPAAKFCPNCGAPQPSRPSAGPRFATNPTAVILTSLGEVRVELLADAAPRTVENFVDLAEGRKEFTDAKTKLKVTRPYYDGLSVHAVHKNIAVATGCQLATGRSGPGYPVPQEINAWALGLDQIKVHPEPNRPHAWLQIRDRAQWEAMIWKPLLDAANLTPSAFKDRVRGPMRQKWMEGVLASLTLLQAYENIGYVFDESLPSVAATRGTLMLAGFDPADGGACFTILTGDLPHLNGRATVFGRVTAGMDVVDAIDGTEVDTKQRPKTPITIMSIRLVK